MGKPEIQAGCLPERHVFGVQGELPFVIGAARSIVTLARRRVPGKRLLALLQVGGIDPVLLWVSALQPVAQLRKPLGLEGLDQCILCAFERGERLLGLALQREVKRLLLRGQAAHGVHNIALHQVQRLLLGPGGTRLEVAGQTVEALMGRHVHWPFTMSGRPMGACRFFAPGLTM